AAVTGSVAALQVLVEAGAHLEALNQHGQTALTQAAFYGNAEAVVFLLSVGADPNAHAEPNHQTPLRAILSGWTATLSRRSRLPPKDDQRFAATWALIRAGADPHFGPGNYPPPAMMAEALGGEIGRLFTGNPTDPGQRPR
ncbi:MAG: ankyrin repeat domain-containing protein, partial [Acidobacteriota bacterium]|nr:ankyrin repeat domain-containing protein [Acidobacteriota bacterium]